jgi:hypothetical protein
MVKSFGLFLLSVLFAPKIFSQSGAPNRIHLPLEADPNQTVTFEEMKNILIQLDATFPTFHLDSVGVTDIGLPLYYAVVSSEPVKNREDAIAKGKPVIFINNGIHPGEPEGIDATLLLVRDMLSEPKKYPWLEKIVLVIVPCYNLDGMLRRNSYSRANQNGPASYGFRGNARNLDLNRDFIKADSQNARSFFQLFQRWQPHLFLDNHTSNGADYQHTMTLLQTLPDKLGGPMTELMQSQLIPYLYHYMEKSGWPMCPYVVTRSPDPADGIYAFNDSPRYSSGYAALFGAISLLSETHMLKPFIDRMESTKVLMQGLMEWASSHSMQLINQQDAHFSALGQSKQYAYNWQLDITKVDSILFLGYEREMQPSMVSGRPLGKYNRQKPYARMIPYFQGAKATRHVDIPEAYLIPQAWVEAISRLQVNGIQMNRLEKDTLMAVEAYRIADYKTLANPYEGHYLHYDIKTEIEEDFVLMRKGDWLIPTQQKGVRYILETLEPDAEDSFFAWNFFDGILMAKEGFSDYVFDDLASEWLNKDEALRKRWETRIRDDKKFADDSRAQLQFIYESSPYCEPHRNRYPVFRKK